MILEHRLISAAFILLVVGFQWSSAYTVNSRQKRGGVSDQLMAHYGARKLFPIAKNFDRPSKIWHSQLWKEFGEKDGGKFGDSPMDMDPNTEMDEIKTYQDLFAAN